MPDFDILQGPFTTDQVVSDDPGCDICLDRDIPEAGSPILIATMFADHKDDPPPHILPPHLARKLAMIFAAGTELLAALEKLAAAVDIEWLYQTGQLADRQPTPRSVVTELADCREQVNAAIAKAKGSK